MAVTTNLGITKIEASQSQKEVTANTAFDVLDKAIAGTLSKTITSSDITLTGSEGQNAILVLSGTLTGNRNLIVPTASKIFLVYNNTSGAYTVTVKTSGGTGVVIPQGGRQIVLCDGTNVVSIAGDAYDVGGMKNGTPDDGEILLRLIAVRPFTFPSGFAGSIAKAGVAATGTSTFDLKKNGGSAFGTFQFAGAATVATFTLASPESFVVGDILTVTAPTTADATLADLAFTLRGILS